MLLLCGCPNPNTYTAPRTLDPGVVQLTLAPEVYAYSSKATTTTPAGVNSTSTISGVTPTLPTLGIRYGLAEGVELGGRFANFNSIAGDAKVRLRRGTFDVAIDPGLQAMYLVESSADAVTPPSTATRALLLYLYAPLLLGFNLSEVVTLVASPGVAYSVSTSQVHTGVDSQQAGISTEPLVTFGLGVDIRPTESLAWHPEVTCMKGIGDANAFFCMGGVALKLGAQPSYSDLAGAGSPSTSGD